MESFLPFCPIKKQFLINLTFFLDNNGEQGLPEAVHFVRNLTENLSLEFPDLWKLGQAYFKGDLVVDADAGKSAVFKEMVLGSIRYFCNLIRAAVIPQTFDKKGEDVVEYGDWGHDGKKIGPWYELITCFHEFCNYDLFKNSPSAPLCSPFGYG